MDFLKTMRATHRLLIVACIAAVLAVPVPQSSINYFQAFVGLQYLERLDGDPLSSLVGEHINTILGLQSGGKRIGVAVGPQSATNMVAQMNAGWGVMSRLLKSTFPDDKEISFRNASLLEIQRAAYTNLSLPIPPESMLEEVSACALNAQTDFPALVQADYSYPRTDLALPGDDGYWEGNRSYRQKTAKVIVNGELCTEFQFTFLRLGELIPRSPDESDIVRAMRDRTFAGEPYSSALALSEPTAWDIVSNLTVAEAKRELMRRLETGGSSTSVLGFSMFRTLAVYAVPALIVVAQLFLWIHATAARGKLATDKPVIAWIGIYSGIVSESVAFTSFALFPAFSIGILWLANGFQIGLPALGALVSGGLGIAACQRVQALREELR